MKYFELICEDFIFWEKQMIHIIVTNHNII